jgi:hypothetical protein
MMFEGMGRLSPRVALVVVATTLLVVVGRAVPARLGRAVLALGIVAALLGTAALIEEWLSESNGPRSDFLLFREAGLAVWAGTDPYRNPRFVSPPTALPLFALFALAPLREGTIAWCLVNSVGLLLLVPLARSALVAQRGLDGDEDRAGLDAVGAVEVGLLTAAVALSDGVRFGLELGQMAVLTAACLQLALRAQGRGRPVAAGVLLGLATIKVGTMLPFLLLFQRRVDRPSWAALAATVALLCLVPGRPAALPGELRAVLDHIAWLSQPGRANDITFLGPQSASILGLDHASYRLGLRRPPGPQVAQGVALVALGGILAAAIRRRRVARPTAVALVALFCIIFLYHRHYDAVIFAPAMVVAAGRARTLRGRPRWAAAGALAAMLGVLYLRAGRLKSLSDAAPAWGLAGRVVQAVVLPYGTWLTLLAIALVWASDRAVSATQPVGRAV